MLFAGPGCKLSFTRMTPSSVSRGEASRLSDFEVATGDLGRSAQYLSRGGGDRGAVGCRQTTRLCSISPFTKVLVKGDAEHIDFASVVSLSFKSPEKFTKLQQARYVCGCLRFFFSCTASIAGLWLRSFPNGNVNLAGAQRSGTGASPPHPWLLYHRPLPSAFCLCCARRCVPTVLQE